MVADLMAPAKPKVVVAPPVSGNLVASLQPPADCTVDLGTPIRFVADPPEAFKLAKQQNKLVLMLHLSGNFEDKCFS